MNIWLSRFWSEPKRREATRTTRTLAQRRKGAAQKRPAPGGRPIFEPAAALLLSHIDTTMLLRRALHPVQIWASKCSYYFVTGPKDIFLLTLGRLAQALLTVVSLRLLTALLSPAQVGSFYLVLSFTAWFGLFLVNPVGMYINRRLHGWHRDNTLLERFKAFNVYVFAVAVLSLPLVFSAKVFFGLGSDIALIHFLAVVALYIYANTWNQTTVPALNMLGHRGAFVGFSVLTTALGLAFSVAIAAMAGKTAASWLYGQILAMFLVYLPASKRLKAFEKAGGAGSALCAITQADLKNLRLFAGPLAAATFFMWLQTQSYRLIVEKFVGAEFLGYLVVGLSIAISLAGVTESLVQQIYYPDFYKKLSGTGPEERKNALSELAQKTIPVYVILASFVFFMSQHLTRLLVDHKFQTAWKFAAIGAFIELFRMISNTFSAAAHAEMKTSALVGPYFWGGSLTAAAVLAACVSGEPGLVIPACMAAGGLVTLVLVKRNMAELSGFKTDKAACFKSILLSAGFVPALLFGRQESLWRALLIVAVFGLYFLFAQWRVILTEKGLSGKFDFSEVPPDIEAQSFKAEV